MPDLQLKESPIIINNYIGSEHYVRKTDKNSIGCKLHWHESIELFYVYAGSVHMSIGNDSYILHEGDAAIINPNELHCTTRFADNTLHICIKIPKSFVDSCTPDLLHKKYISPLFLNLISIEHKISADQYVQRCFEKLYDCTTRFPRGWELLYKGYVFELLAILWDKYSRADEKSVVFQKEQQSVKRVVEYIDAHFDQPLTLDILAECAGYSSAHLCRKFKLLCGVSPMQYLNHIRCENASRMLCDSGLSVTETCFAAGFNDPNYFSKVFKKIYAKSPRAFKKSL